MDIYLQAIEEFNKKFHQDDPKTPTADIDSDYAKLRIMLMKEELHEVTDAIKSKKIEEIAAELADLVYVVMGTVSAFGLSDIFEKVFMEKHRSNMSKTHVPGEGKPQKLEGYREADIDKILDQE